MTRLRIATPADGPAVAAIYAPHVDGSSTSFEAAAPTGAEMARRIEARLATHPWLVAEQGALGDAQVGAEVLGYAYAGPFRERAAYQWTCETSVYLAESARGRGVGTALMRALLAVLEAQGYRAVVACVTLPNPASARFHESLGFAPVGVFRGVGHKLGRAWDVGFWQLALRGAGVPPKTPTPFAKLELPAALPAWPR